MLAVRISEHLGEDSTKSSLSERNREQMGRTTTGCTSYRMIIATLVLENS